jgi:uncharacterized protein YndB with AHSA1/START domain
MTMSSTEITAEPGTALITITREFDASPEQLLQAYVDPKLLALWLGPRRLSMDVVCYEPEDGGRWRYVQSGEDGVAHGFHGVFHGTPSVENGIVQTFEYEGAPGHVSLDTATFIPRDGKTVLRMDSAFQSVEARDAMVASGMAEGIEDSMDRLTELLGGE